MYIYYARPIRGTHLDNATAVYHAVINAIKSTGHFSQWDIPSKIPPREGRTESERIYERDLAWIAGCSGLIAECSGPSTGVGIEIGFALFQLHIPCLFLAHSGTRLSQMVLGSGQEIAYYKEYKDIGSIVRGFIERCAERAEKASAEAYEKLHANGWDQAAREGFLYGAGLMQGDYVQNPDGSISLQSVSAVDLRFSPDGGLSTAERLSLRTHGPEIYQSKQTYPNGSTLPPEIMNKAVWDKDRFPDPSHALDKDRFDDLSDMPSNIE